MLVLLVAVGISVAALPRDQVVQTVDEAKSRVDELLDDLMPAAAELSDDATRLFEDLRDKLERRRREVFASEDERPRLVAERQKTKVFRPNLTGHARVLDGDTLDIGRTRVRLHGIDAPESRQSCVAGGQRWPCGERATRMLEQRIGSRTVTCEVRDRDRYGRSVAVCHAAGEDLNGWLVREGWALAYRRYSRDYVSAEQSARAARRGMWRGDFVKPWDWRRGERLAGSRAPATAAAGGRCRIKGNIGRDGSRIYHLPGGQYYDRTPIETARGERWFCTEREARTAGWRKSRR